MDKGTGAWSHLLLPVCFLGMGSEPLAASLPGTPGSHATFPLALLPSYHWGFLLPLHPAGNSAGQASCLPRCRHDRPGAEVVTLL